MSGVEFLVRNVYAGCRVGSAWSTRYEADAGAAGRLPAGLRHDCGPALVAANGYDDIAIVQGIQSSNVALAGNAKYVAHTMDDELVDQNLGGRPRAVIGAHQHSSP